MFLPIGDQPNPRGTPFVNYALIAANVLVYLLITLPLSAQRADPGDPRLQEYIEVIGQNLPPNVSLREVASRVTAYDLFLFSWGYRPAEGSLVTLFTAMFLHGGFMHIFGNMLFLWIYGDNVEHRLGKVLYLLAYLVTGVAATLFFALFASDSRVPMVGASGAISGVLGFYFVWFPKNQVKVWIFLFPFFMNVVLLPARIVLGFFLILENLLPFLLSARGGGGGVAHGAHIGGFLAGLAIAWVMDRKQVATRPEEYRDRRWEPPKQTARQVIESELRRGNYQSAADDYFRLSSEETRRLLTPDDSIALGNWLAKNGHSRAALTVYQRHLRDYPQGPGAAEAHAYAGLVQLHAFREPTAAYQHLVEALDYDPPPDLEALIRRSLAEIADRQKFELPRFRR